MKKRIFSFLLVLALLLTTFAAFGMDGAAADSARDVQLSEGVRNIARVSDDGHSVDAAGGCPRLER